VPASRYPSKKGAIPFHHNSKEDLDLDLETRCHISAERQPWDHPVTDAQEKRYEKKTGFCP
jgi:hypothetical protein